MIKNIKVQCTKNSSMYAEFEVIDRAYEKMNIEIEKRNIRKEDIISISPSIINDGFSYKVSLILSYFEN